MAGATGVPFLDGQPLEILNNGDEFYPAMLEAIERRRASRSPSRPTSTGPATSACSSRERWRERAQAGRQRQDPARRRRLGDDRRRHPGDARSRRVPARLVQPDPLVHHRPLQPPHAPQVAHHRRPHRRSPAAPASPITGGATRRTPTHWRDMQIRIEGPAVTPLQTGFAQNWLQTTGELISGGCLLSADRAARRPRRADDHELAGDRRVDRPHDVLPVDRLRAPSRSTSPIRTSCPTRPRSTRWSRRSGAASTCASWCRASTTTTGWRGRTASGCTAACSRPGIEILEYNHTMLHQKTMVVDGVLGDGRHDELRQPLVRAQRGEQRLRLRSGHCAAAARHVRGRSRGMPGDQARGVAPPRPVGQVQEVIASFLQDQV